jgi:glycosyltransferase involved in cell wall biosynthesis
MEGISVIIPVKGRVTYLKRLLESIKEAKKQTLVPIEVIVIDDSIKETKTGIEALCEKFQADYHYLKESVSEKRNYGMRIAKFPVIFFTDSDCEVEHNIFNEHLKCYSCEGICGCAGLTEFTGERTWFWNVIERMSFLYPFQWAKTKDYVPWVPCTNISFKKEVIEKENGFRSMLPPKESAEDVDLGYRITSSGYKIRCNANAKVFHSRGTWTRPTQFIERTFRFGRGEYYLMKNHPDNTFLDVPKTSLIFIFLLILFIYKSVISRTFLYAISPFIWLPVTILLQATFALKYRLINGVWRDIGYIYMSLSFETLFEFGTVIECIKKGDLKFLFRKFIYIEDQLFSRWYWGIIKMWSFIVSLFVLLIFLAIL